MKQIKLFYVPIIYAKQETKQHGETKTYFIPRELSGFSDKTKAYNSLYTALLQEPVGSFGEVKETSLVVEVSSLVTVGES